MDELTTFLEIFPHYFSPQINQIRWYGKVMYSVCTYAPSHTVLYICEVHRHRLFPFPFTPFLFLPIFSVHMHGDCTV